MTSKQMPPNNRLQRTALRATAEPERYEAGSLARSEVLALQGCRPVIEEEENSAPLPTRVAARLARASDGKLPGGGPCCEGPGQSNGVAPQGPSSCALPGAVAWLRSSPSRVSTPQVGGPLRITGRRSSGALTPILLPALAARG